MPRRCKVDYNENDGTQQYHGDSGSTHDALTTCASTNACGSVPVLRLCAGEVSRGATVTSHGLVGGVRILQQKQRIRSVSVACAPRQWTGCINGSYFIASTTRSTFRLRHGRNTCRTRPARAATVSADTPRWLEGSRYNKPRYFCSRFSFPAPAHPCPCVLFPYRQVQYPELTGCFAVTHTQSRWPVCTGSKWHCAPAHGRHVDLPRQRVSPGTTPGRR